MARIGKIARLQAAVRAQLNSRIHDGLEGKQIVLWLNSLPEVRKVLADKFDARPINEQNLTDWRQGGYQEWLATQDILAQAAELAASRRELQDVAPGHSFTDHLAHAHAFRYAALLASQGQVLDEPSLRQLHALDHTCQAVVNLRRNDQNAARLQIETERWERTRQQLDDERSEIVKSRQRKELAAPIWQAIRQAERRQQPGGDKAARMAVGLLDEIENCPDPAHFQSKVLASLSLAELRGDLQEQAKKNSQNQTEDPVAPESLRESETTPGLRKSKRGHPSRQTRSNPRRRSRKPAVRRPTRIPRAPRPAQPAEPAAVASGLPLDSQPSAEPAAVASSLPLDSQPSTEPAAVASSLRLDSQPSTEPAAVASSLRLDSPPGGEQPPIKPGQA